MNLNTISPREVVQAYATIPKKNAAPAAAPAPSSAPRETVEFSDSSVSFQKVVDKLNTLPDVRIQIVEEIRQRIKNNDYPLENNLQNALEGMVASGVLASAN